MTTLIHVQAALKAQDKQRAGELVKMVLKKDPCEYSLYIAARLNNDPSKKIKFLKQALDINPNHKSSQKYLRYVESSYIPLSNRIMALIKKLSLKQMYGQLTRLEQGVILSGLAFVIIAGISLMLSIGSNPKVVSTTDQQFSYIQINNPDSVLTHFESHSLDIASMELQPIPVGLHPGQYIEFGLQDLNGKHLAQILVYENYSALANDIENIKLFSGNRPIQANKNTVLIFSSELTSETEIQLLAAYNAISNR